MDDGRVRLRGDEGTFLETLYGKALDAAAAHPILGDRFAADAVARIDFDFETLKLPNGAAITLPLRALHFDRWTRAFLAENPSSVVLHLGCGLDTRVYRIDAGPEVAWYDVDLPAVIALRERLYPTRPGYHLVAASVTDPAWLESIPGDRPVFVLGEGLMMYIPEREAVALVRRITGTFPRGQVAFDAYSRAMVRLVSRLSAVRRAKVRLVWGIADPRELEREVPGLRLVEVVPFLAMPELMARLGKSGVSRALHRAMARLAFYRNLVRHVRYEFP